MTEGARARILKAGGTIMTFDQLALKSPKGKNTLLIQGKLGILSAIYPSAIINERDEVKQLRLQIFFFFKGN